MRKFHIWATSMIKAKRAARAAAAALERWEWTHRAEHLAEAESHQELANFYLSKAEEVYR